MNNFIETQVEKQRDSYKKEFGEPEKYKPRDRSVSQLANLINGDEFAEALDDQYDNFSEGSCVMQKDFYDMHIKHLETIVKQVTLAVCDEIKNEILKEDKDNGWEIMENIKDSLDELKKQCEGE